MQAAMTALQSAGLITAALALVTIPGIAVLAFLRLRLTNQAFWLLAPPVGLAAVVLILQNLVYLNLRVGVTAWPLVVASSVVLVMALRRHLVPPPPRALLVVLALVVAVHAAGYLTIGARRFIGSGWIDGWNYTTTAQFLADYRFETGLADVNHTPYLARAITLKDDRIGQSVLHAAVATIGRTNAKRVWGATSMLGPVLTACALLLLIRDHLPGHTRWIAALSATLVPGVGMIHLESFLSQTVVLPLLLAWPVVAASAVETPDWRHVTVAAVWLAAAHACYSEFTPIFVGVLGALAILPELRHPSVLLVRVGRAALVLVGAALLNPAFVLRSISVLQRSVAAEHPIMLTIYPFAYGSEGLVRLWLGAPLVKLGAPAARIQTVAAVVLTILGAAGMVRWLVRRWSAESIGATLIVLAPVAVLMLQGTSYQFYKLLLTASPLLMIGVWMAVLPFDRVANVRLAALVVLVLLPTATAAASLSWRVAHGGSRAALVSTVTLDAPFDDLCARLERTAGHAYVISSEWADHRAGWLAYHARRNRVWLESTLFGGRFLREIPEPMPFLDRSTIPTDAVLLRPATIGEPPDCPNGC
jgi:hypothetical protein